MFNFPWTNFHELNLDWILSVVKQAKDVFENGRAEIEHAVETADEAKEIATQAAAGTIADNSISTAKLQNSAVTSAKIADNAVTTAKLDDSSVTSAKIVNRTIQPQDLDQDLEDNILGYINNKNIVLLGDSNAARFAALNPFDNTGASFTSYAQGGACWSVQNVTNILTQYNIMASDFPTNSPDFVILWAGGNDITTYFPDFGLPKFGVFTDPAEQTSFESIRHILYLLRTNYPGAKIIGVVRDNKPTGTGNAARENYFNSIMENIFSAWSVPVVSLEGILNNTPNNAQSAAYNLESDLVHYKDAALYKIRALIVNAMKTGLNSHKFRTMTTLFAPSSVTTEQGAIDWVVSSLFDTDNYSRNNILSQSGYNVWYDMNGTPKSVACSVMCPANAVYSNNVDSFIRNGAEHKELYTVRIPESVFTDFKNINDGFYVFRGPYRPTVNVPQAIIDNYTGGMIVIGTWSVNRSYYQGFAFFPFLVNYTIPNSFILHYAGGTWSWRAISDPSIHYDFNQV